MSWKRACCLLKIITSFIEKNYIFFLLRKYLFLVYMYICTIRFYSVSDFFTFSSSAWQISTFHTLLWSVRSSMLFRCMGKQKCHFLYLLLCLIWGFCASKIREMRTDHKRNESAFNSACSVQQTNYQYHKEFFFLFFIPISDMNYANFYIFWFK